MTSRLAALLLLLSSICFSQTTPAKPAAPGNSQTPPVKKATDSDAKKPSLTPSPSAATVSENEVVITVPGVCPPEMPADNCSTKITRGDFERLIAAMNPNIPVEARRSIGSSYGQLIYMAHQAQKMGVDKDPNLQIQMRVQAMSLLAQGLQKKVLESSKPTAQEIESYHAENSGKYEELNLRRMVVLKSASNELKPEQLKALADDLRERVAAGEDPDKLQIEAYKTAKSAGTPPSTSLGWKKRGMMDPRHEPQIVALKAGEVSQVLEDGQAYYIYKVDSKRLVPMENVQKDIEKTLTEERARKTLQQLTENAKPKLNEAYFGPAPDTAKPPAQTPPPK